MCVAMCVDHVNFPSYGWRGEANGAGIHFLQYNGLVVEILAQAILRLPKHTSIGPAGELKTACGRPTCLKKIAILVLQWIGRGCGDPRD